MLTLEKIELALGFILNYFSPFVSFCVYFYFLLIFWFLKSGYFVNFTFISFLQNPLETKNKNLWHSRTTCICVSFTLGLINHHKTRRFVVVSHNLLDLEETFYCILSMYNNIVFNIVFTILYSEHFG